MATIGERTIWKKSNDLASNSSDAWDDTELIKAYDKSIANLKLGNSEPDVKDTHRKKKKKMKKESSLKSEWKVGEKCLAVYDEDGLYYEATILSVNKGSVYVVFDYYENEEEVEFENLLPIEEKSNMEVATGVTDDAFFDNVISEDKQSLSDESQNQNSNKKDHVNWQVSDICYIANKKGKYDKAVINGFKSSKVCRVTLIDSNKKKEVNISQLFSYIPDERSRKNSSKHSGCSNKNSLPFDKAPSMQRPNQPFMNTFFPMSNLNMDTNCPPLPPPPTLSEDVINGDEEALANMLMSWYISGYYSGYYQGMNNNRSVRNNTWADPFRNCRRRGDKTFV